MVIQKIGLRSTNDFYIGYLEKSNGYWFYYPDHSIRIVKTKNARFNENDEVSESEISCNVEIQEVRVQVFWGCYF